MKALRLLLFAILIYGALVSEAAAQIPSERKYDPNKTVLHALENAIQVKHGSPYEVSFHIMDSLIANSSSDEITDPYGTLKGCVLFSARHTWQSEDSIITGMYKDNRIIWDDYPGTRAGFGGGLVTTKDINNDGEVDILAAQIDPDRNTREASISYLWILSWNGTTGKMINDTDPVTHQSTLVSTDSWYDIVDINRNGVMVIRGEIDRWQQDFPSLNPSTLPGITYSWDGSKYGFFPSAHQITANEFYPANMMSVSIHCKVSQSGDLYTYRYICLNRSTSKQSVEYIYIGGLEDTSSVSAPTGWRASSSGFIGGRFFYSKSFDIRGMISPGRSLGGFRTVSPAPPAIVKYYVQGFRRNAQIATDEERRKDILTNSVSGYNLGTMDTSVRTMMLDFLDTLISFKHQCVTLGWLRNGPAQGKDEDDDKADEGIVERLDRRLDKAKAALAKSDSVKARLELELFAKEVEQLYGKEDEGERSKEKGKEVLTSEGYALLKYNAEYLIDKLPEGYGKRDERRGKK